jgi:3-oxoacyl-[acyl-carrier-protein] synthase-3
MSPQEGWGACSHLLPTGHDRIVFPSTFVPELDLSVMNSLEQLDAVVRGDLEVKAPSGTDFLHRGQEGAYASRYHLMGDLA